MRFASIAIACLLSVSAKDNLANQHTSLKSMVQATGEWDTNNMISSISARKIELEDALEAGTMSKAEVASELKYLLQLVRDVESNNKAHAVTTLTARKSSLVNLEETSEETKEETKEEGKEEGKEEETPAATEDDATEEEKEDHWLSYEGGIEKIKEEITARESRVATAEGAVEALKNDPEATDAEKQAADKELEDANASLKRA